MNKLIQFLIFSSQHILNQEFNINTELDQDALHPSIASTSTGFVAVWATQLPNNNFTGDIKACLFDDNGAMVGSIFTVNTQTSNDQVNPHVASFPDDTFIITWESQSDPDRSNADPSAYGVFGQVFDASASPVGGEFQVNATNLNSQRGSNMTVLSNGGFVVIWTSLQNNSTSLSDIQAQMQDENQTKIYSEVVINSSTESDEYPDIAALSFGKQVITWQSMSDHYQIKAQIINYDGIIIGSEFMVNTNINNNNVQPKVIYLYNETFVISWVEQRTNNSAIMAQIFESDGTRVGNEIVVDYVESADAKVSLSQLPSSHFVVIYNENTYLEGENGIKYQMQTPNGDKLGSKINPSTNLNLEYYDIDTAKLSDGRFVSIYQQIESHARSKVAFYIQQPYGYDIRQEYHCQSPLIIDMQDQIDNVNSYEITQGTEFGDLRIPNEGEEVTTGKDYQLRELKQICEDRHMTNDTFAQKVIDIFGLESEEQTFSIVNSVLLNLGLMALTLLF